MILGKPNDAGAALISVLLLVILMSVAALGMTELVIGGVEKSKAADGRSRQSWQITGAEQAGLSGIARLWTVTQGELYEGAPGLGSAFTIETNGAQVTARLEDASNCFNLNALSGANEDTIARARAEENYRILLEQAGFLDREIDNLTDALIDWMDGDNATSDNGAEDGYYANLRPPYRTSGTMLAERSELRAIRGYTVETVARLAPFICVNPSDKNSVLNINTLQADEAALLSMVFSGALGTDIARDIILARPLGGWRSVEAFLANERLARIASDLRQLDLISTRSEFLVLRGQIDSQAQITEFAIKYEAVAGQSPRILSRHLGGM